MIALALFRAMCEVGNSLERARELYVPWSDDWLMLTEILANVDAAVDILVESTGVGGADDAVDG